MNIEATARGGKHFFTVQRAAVTALFQVGLIAAALMLACAIPQNAYADEAKDDSVALQAADVREPGSAVADAAAEAPLGVEAAPQDDAAPSDALPDQPGGPTDQPADTAADADEAANADEVAASSEPIADEADRVEAGDAPVADDEAAAQDDATESTAKEAEADAEDAPRGAGARGDAEAAAGIPSEEDEQAPEADQQPEGDEDAQDETAVAGSSLTMDDDKGTQAAKTIQGAWTRLSGQDALETMEEVVGAGFTRSATVVIATRNSYHDALAASGLAGAYKAPILLTDKNTLSEETLSEIQRLKATQAFVCGGTGSISKSVFDRILSLGLSTERIAGTTSIETAVALAERMGTNKGTTAILATASTYHDALSIAPYAYAFKAPVFLVNPASSLGSATSEALSEGGYKRILIAGGTGSVSEAAEEQAKEVKGVTSVRRLAGQNAYGTSVEVANWGLSNGMSVNKMGVASASGYWDALTGAALCGKNKAVLVLADDNNLSAVIGFINRHRSSIKKGYVFGGTASVGSYAMETVASGKVASVYETLGDVDLAGHTKVGIDVSVWNGSIDWSQVKASGVDYAIVRVGYGSDFTSQDDTRYLEYVRGAKAAGIPLGVYLYSYANSTALAKSEAAHTLRLLREAGLKPSDVPYGVYYDLEEPSLQSASNRTLLANMATEYCNAISDAGYTPGVYANLNWWNNYLTSPVFNNWQRWVAQYNSACWYTGSYVMWQCKSTGRVPGISGSVDMNLYYR